MTVATINFTEKFSKFNELWSPKVIAEMNDYQFKLVKAEGEFTWHQHSDTDEVFILLEGELTIMFRDHQVKLTHGEMCVVPKGKEHKPVAQSECKILFIEPKGVINTGDSDCVLTAPNEAWI